MEATLKLARLMRYARSRANSPEETDAEKWRHISHLVIQVLRKVIAGELAPERLAALDKYFERYALNGHNKACPGQRGNNHDNFGDSLDIYGKSGSIKLETPRTDSKPRSAGSGKGGWVTINGTHVQIGKGGEITKGPPNLKGTAVTAGVTGTGRGTSSEAKRPENEPEVLRQFNRYEPGSKTEAEKLAQVNPNGYKNNCQRCVLAYEMIERGYDVTAKPYSPRDPLGALGLKALKLTDPSHLDPDHHFLLEKSRFRNEVNALFDLWGDGSRAAIRVTWDEKYGGDTLSRMHVFIAKRVGEKIVYLDPQINKVLNLQETLDKTADDSWGWIQRIDNKEVSKLITYAVENRKERSK